MALFIHKLGSTFEAELFMQGGVPAAKDLRGKPLFLHGLTLITTGAFVGTITFVSTPASVQVPISAQEVLSQIDTQSGSALKAGLTREGHLYLIDAGVPTVAVSITGTGTANPILGFPSATSAGKVYAPPSGVAPRVLSVSPSSLDANVLILLTEET